MGHIGAEETVGSKLDNLSDLGSAATHTEAGVKGCECVCYVCVLYIISRHWSLIRKTYMM